MMHFKNPKNQFLAIMFFLSGLMAQSQSYTVDIDMSPAQMVQNLVGNGVTISNVVVTACDSTYGYYYSQNTELGTSNGLLLTTGKALYSVGPNNTVGNCSTSAGTCDYFDNDCPGSPLLDQAQDRTTRDATCFEFDIVPKGDSLRFEYTFASEEYNEWVNSPFNDVFGFYITGPNVGTDVNIALVPNTSQVVAINTVNALSNSTYFYNNQNPLGQYIQYDGFTIDLAAAIGNLIPCATYHLKFVIADGTDHVYDSGVFINAIESNPIVILSATSNGLDYMVEGCNTGTISFAREEITDQPQDVLYWIGGTASNGVDYSPQIGSGIPLDQNTITIPANSQSVSFDINALLDGLTEGQEFLTVYLDNPSCTGTQLLDSLNFYIYDFVDINIVPDVADICFGQCVDLSGVSDVNDLGTFEWTGAVSDPDSLTVQVCPEVTTTYSLTVSVGSCQATDDVTVNVSNISLELSGSDINCEGGTTGSITVDVIGAIEPYEYAWTGPDGYVSTDSIPSNLAPGEYCVTVTDGAGCVASGCVTLIQVNELTASAELSDYNCSMVSCYGSCDGEIDVTLQGGVFPYSYSWTGPNGFTWSFMDVTDACAGTYELTITDSVGCQYTNSYTLLEPDSVELVVVGTVDLLCTGFETGQASVEASGGCSPYTYSWSHDALLNGPTAIGLGSGTYDVSVTDQNNCTNDGTVTIVINEPIDPLNVTVDEISVYPGGFGVSCPGSTDGYINISVSGGLLDYSISWFSVSDNSVFSNSEDLVDAPCGEYVLTVTDGNDCSYTQSLQISCVPAITVEYDVVNNACGAPEAGGGSITITNTSGGQGPAYDYEWNGPSCVPCLTDNITNLNSGDYVLTVSDALGCSTTITVNIGENDGFVATGTITDISCTGACDGMIDLDITDGSGGGGADFLVNSATDIQVCVTGTHTWVSDLTFLLEGPPSCGSPEIILSLHPFAIGQPANCNSGNNFSDLCFSTSSGNNLDVCAAGAPLTGTFGSYSSSVVAIDWDALNGCNINEAGWSVKVQDCVLTDFGILTEASISFNGTDSQNNPQTVNYMTPGGFNSAISNAAAQGCDPNVLAEFVVDESMVNSGGGGGNNGNYTFEWSGPFTGNPPTTEDISGLCPGTYTVVITSGDCEQTLTFDIIEPEPLQIVSVAVINPTCFGQNNGSIDIEMTGGSGDYTYLWVPAFSCFFNGSSNQDISNLFECCYSLVVTDNVTGCQAFQTFCLEAPQVMDIVVVTSEFDGGYNISCDGANDGQISVFVTGGSPDCDQFSPYCYQYDWITDCSEIDPSLFGNDPNAPNATNLPGGTYGINVTDSNGCLATTCLEMLEPDPLDSPAIIENIDCNSTTGCITPGLTGGSGLYIVYEWTGNIGSNNPDDVTLCGLEAGDYTLTITDSNNCQETFDYTIEETPALILNLDSQTDVTCYGQCDGTMSFSIDGGDAPYFCILGDTTYILDAPGILTIPNLCAGIYPVLLTDANDCQASTSVTIIEPDSIMIDLLSILQEANQIFDIQCFGDSTGAINSSVIGGTGLYSYTWTDEALNIIGTEANIDSLVAGTYCLEVMDESLCSAQQCLEITQPDTPLDASGVISLYNEIYNVSCYDATDGSITLNITGGVEPYTFNWNGEGTIETAQDQINLGAGLYDVLITDANFCSILLQFELLEPTPIVIDATLSLFDGGANISCNGACDGTISLAISGGEPGYNVVWSGPNGFTSDLENLIDLCAGTYNVSVTDANNCTVSQSFIIAEPETLSVSITQNYNCATGTIDLCTIVNGGSGNYEYSWSNGENGACTVGTADGEVCVTVTDSNDCTAEVCVTIDVNTPLDVSGIVTDASCGLCNGAIDITISGGFQPISWTWSGGELPQDLTQLCANDYTITVTDNNDCSSQLTFSVEDGPGITLQVDQVDVRCFGETVGSATAIVTGGTPVIEYSWEDENGNEIGTGPSISNLGAGDYSVIITDGVGCEASQSITILQASALDVTIELSVQGDFNISAPNGSDGAIELTVTGGTPEYTYDWSPLDIPDDENGVTGLPEGDYQVIIQDINGCKIDTTITLTAPRDIKLYTALSPNGDGFNDFYVIDGVLYCPGNQFKVFNRWGNLVYDVTNYKNEWYGQHKDGGPLADGTYFVIFEGCGKELSTYVDLRRE